MHVTGSVTVDVVVPVTCYQIPSSSLRIWQLQCKYFVKYVSNSDWLNVFISSLDIILSQVCLISSSADFSSMTVYTDCSGFCSISFLVLFKHTISVLSPERFSEENRH